MLHTGLVSLSILKKYFTFTPVLFSLTEYDSCSYFPLLRFHLCRFESSSFTPHSHTNTLGCGLDPIPKWLLCGGNMSRPQSRPTARCSLQVGAKWQTLQHSQRMNRAQWRIIIHWSGNKTKQLTGLEKKKLPQTLTANFSLQTAIAIPTPPFTQRDWIMQYNLSQRSCLFPQQLSLRAETSKETSCEHIQPKIGDGSVTPPYIKTQ